MNLWQATRWVPEYLNRNLDSQPWNLALIICFTTGQIFLRTCDHRHLWLAPLLAVSVISITTKRRASFHPRVHYTKTLLLLTLCLSFTLRWDDDLRHHAKVYQKYQLMNQGGRPVKVRGFIDEDFTFRVNRPLRGDPDTQLTLPFRLETGERVELGMKQDTWLKTKGQRTLEVSGHLTVLRQAPNPGGFDAHILGAGRGVYLRLSATSVRVIRRSQTLTWQERARLLRTYLFNYLCDLQGDEFAGFYLAIWTGDRRFVSERLLAATNTLGISYRLSPTGQQLGLWYLVLPQLVRNKERKNRQRLRFTIIFILTLLMGGSVGLVKALLFQALIAYQRMHNLNLSRSQTLGLAGVIMLTYRPSLIVHPGFFLSMAISSVLNWPLWPRQQMEDFGIHPETRQGKKNLRLMTVKAKGLRLVTIIVFLPTLLHVVGMTPNRLTMITMMFTPAIQLLGIPAILLTKVAPGLGQWMMEQLVNLADVASQAGIRLWTLDLIRLFLLGIFISCGVLLRYYTVWRIAFDKRKLRVMAVAASCFMLFINRLYAWPPSLELRVTFFSVGSADMILCETRVATYLIDTGEHEGHTGILLDALALRRWRKSALDAIILSHEDTDHSGGIHAVLKYLPVNLILTPTTRDLSLGVDEHLRREVMKQFTWKDGAWSFTLYPMEAEEAVLASENDRSLVLHIEGDQTLLFTGDIESKREIDMLQYLAEVDVLKVPHHGSRTSSTPAFLDHIKPKIAVISVGPRHGHPHDQVLARYGERKIPLYRTDEQGAIIYTVRAGRGYVETIFSPGKEHGFLSSLLRVN